MAKWETINEEAHVRETKILEKEKMFTKLIV